MNKCKYNCRQNGRRACDPECDCQDCHSAPQPPAGEDWEKEVESWFSLPDYHDPKTHKNYPTKMVSINADLWVEKIKKLISQLLKEKEAEAYRRAGNDVIENLANLTNEKIIQARQDAFAEILEWAGKQMKELRESKLKTRYGNRDNAVRFNVLRCVQDFIKDKQKQND